jgi:hypothetical protein
MGDDPRAERIVDGLQGSLFQIDIAKIIVHEGDEPNAVVDLLNAELLTGEHGRDIDLLPVHTDAAAGGDQDIAVVERVFEVGQAMIAAR